MTHLFQGLNNYLEESLEQVPEENTELDTTAWKFSLSINDPEIRSMLSESSATTKWLSSAELGLYLTV